MDWASVVAQVLLSQVVAELFRMARQRDERLSAKNIESKVEAMVAKRVAAQMEIPPEQRQDVVASVVQLTKPTFEEVVRINVDTRRLVEAVEAKHGSSLVERNAVKFRRIPVAVKTSARKEAKTLTTTRRSASAKKMAVKASATKIAKKSDARSTPTIRHMSPVSKPRAAAKTTKTTSKKTAAKKASAKKTATKKAVAKKAVGRTAR